MRMIRKPTFFNTKISTDRSDKFTNLRHFSKMNEQKVIFTHFRPKHRKGLLYLQDGAPKDIKSDISKHSDADNKFMKEKALLIKDGIEILLDFSAKNKYHYEKTKNNKNNFQEDDNTILKLTSPEFSFYTPCSPLSDIMFNDILLTHVYDLAQHLPEFLHFHLASFSVQVTGKLDFFKDLIDYRYFDKDEPQIINCAIIGQCGKNPIVKLYAKQLPYDANPYLAGKQPFSVAYEDIKTHGILVGKSPAGVSFTKAHEMCLENYAKHGIALRAYMKWSVDLPAEKSTNYVGYHDLVSDTIIAHLQNVIFPVLSHNDYTFSQVTILSDDETWKKCDSDKLDIPTGNPVATGSSLVYETIKMLPPRTSVTKDIEEARKLKKEEEEEERKKQQPEAKEEKQKPQDKKQEIKPEKIIEDTSANNMKP